MFSTNMVIACWGGKRRKFDPNKTDSGFYIRQQVGYLKQVKHNLTQITFAVNRARKDLDGYSFLKEIRSLPQQIQNSQVEVIEQPNQGMSYGLLNLAHKTYGDKFTHYIFIEDDTVFVEDHFDQTLLHMIEKKNCGYLCGKVLENPMMHAGVVPGIMSQKVLNDIDQKYGELPHEKRIAMCESYGENEQNGQVRQSNAFYDVGSSLDDVSDKYNVPYWEMKNGIGGLIYAGIYDPDKPVLFKPIESLLKTEVF